MSGQQESQGTGTRHPRNREVEEGKVFCGMQGHIIFFDVFLEVVIELFSTRAE